MTPDMKLIRHILLGLEKDGGLAGRLPPSATEHCLLLGEAGLIEQGSAPGSPRDSGMMGWRNARITPRGICALAALREDENLRLVQQHADALGTCATFAHLKAFLQQVADWGTPQEAPATQP